MLYTFEKDSKSRALKKHENYIWGSAHLKLSWCYFIISIIIIPCYFSLAKFVSFGSQTQSWIGQKIFFFVWEDYFCKHIERILVLSASAERPLNEEKHYQWYHIYIFFSWCFNSIVITTNNDYNFDACFRLNHSNSRHSRKTQAGHCSGGPVWSR